MPDRELIANPIVGSWESVVPQPNKHHVTASRLSELPNLVRLRRLLAQQGRKSGDSSWIACLRSVSELRVAGVVVSYSVVTPARYRVAPPVAGAAGG